VSTRDEHRWRRGDRLFHSNSLDYRYLETDKAVQGHYIDKLSNDTMLNHTLITTNHQALFIYNRNKIHWFIYSRLDGPFDELLLCYFERWTKIEVVISMAESTKVVSPYLVKTWLIIQTYCLYNHLCYSLILCPNTFSKHTKMNFIQKVWSISYLCTKVTSAGNLNFRLDLAASIEDIAP